MINEREGEGVFIPLVCIIVNFLWCMYTIPTKGGVMTMYMCVLVRERVCIFMFVNLCVSVLYLCASSTGGGEVVGCSIVSDGDMRIHRNVGG